MVGRFELARQLLATSNAAYADLGLTLNAASSQTRGGRRAARRGTRPRPRRALSQGRIARSKRWASERSARRSQRILARAILEQGRDEEAENLAEFSARLAASGDLLTQVLWRRVRARVLARRGEIEEAEALAREALAIAEATDFVNDRADALIDLSHVLEASGRRDEAVAAASEALHLYELKGNVVSAATTQERLGQLDKM